LAQSRPEYSGDAPPSPDGGASSCRAARYLGRPLDRRGPAALDSDGPLIPDAILVAPATYNTINKWAQGISDTYALGVLAETTGLAVPTVVLPFVNTALAARAPFRRSVESLRAEGVRILLGPGGFQPHPPRTGGSLIDSYPWHLGINEAERALDPATHNP